MAGSRHTAVLVSCVALPTRSRSPRRFPSPEHDRTAAAFGGRVGGAWRKLLRRRARGYGAGMVQGPLTSVVVMGVSGSGKSTVAKALADRLGWEFGEGDGHHPAANVVKMRAGIPLDDDDRRPWLRELAAWIDAREDEGRSCVLTCSALKRRYRDLLRDGHPSVWFAHVTVSEQLIAERVASRRDHYMPASLVASQLAALEPLGADEPGRTIPATGTRDEAVAAVLAALAEDRGIGIS
jgi:gluconokinase